MNLSLFDRILTLRQENPMKNVISAFFLAILLTAVPAYAASGDDILGVWNNAEKDAKIEIFKCAERYCG
jgi:hypothetical protein